MSSHFIYQSKCIIKTRLANNFMDLVPLVTYCFNLDWLNILSYPTPHGLFSDFMLDGPYEYNDVYPFRPLSATEMHQTLRVATLFLKGVKLRKMKNKLTLFKADRPFPEKYIVKDYIFNTKLEKDDHYIHQNTAQGCFFPLQSYSKKIKKNVPKSARKYTRWAFARKLDIFTKNITVAMAS